MGAHSFCFRLLAEQGAVSQCNTELWKGVKTEISAFLSFYTLETVRAYDFLSCFSPLLTWFAVKLAWCAENGLINAPFHKLCLCVQWHSQCLEWFPKGHRLVQSGHISTPLDSLICCSRKILSSLWTARDKSVTVEILWAEKIWSYSGAVSSRQKRREKWWRCVDSPDWLMWGPPASSLAGASCVTSVLLWMWNEAQNETFSFPLSNDLPLLVNLFCVISV